MAGVAWADGESQVLCEDGIKGTQCGSTPDRWLWDSPSTQLTGATTNSKVYVEGKPVAVQGDKISPHPDGEICTESPVDHEPETSLLAANVRIGGKYVVRIGSKYNKGTTFEHTVTTGSSKVSIGGPDISV